MQPRKLRLVRIEDGDVFSVVAASNFPLQANRKISRWAGYLETLQSADQEPTELLSIDIQFEKDAGIPQLEKLSLADYEAGTFNPNSVHKSFQNDDDLKNLVWPPALRESGKNNGILIGAMVAGRCMAQDLPVGVGIHTAYPTMVARDMSTAMLAAQILTVSGALQVRSSEEALRLAVRNLSKSSAQRRQTVEDILPEMLTRFRDEFLHRAGEGRRLLVDPASLDQLLLEFATAHSDEDLNRRLSEQGILLYDREGIRDCLDVRSVFADMVLQDAMDGYPPYLSLDDVKAPTGPIYLFIQKLAAQSFGYVEPVVEHFKLQRNGVNKEAPFKAERPLHEFIALLFAWCYAYAESLQDTTPYDPMEQSYAPGSEFPSRHAQARALFDILDKIAIQGSDRWAVFNARRDHVPLTRVTGHLSVMEAVSHACENSRMDDTLFHVLRYGRHGDANLAGRRRTAVAHLMQDLVRSGSVDQVDHDGNSWYRLISDRAPALVAEKANNVRILRLLGRPTKDPYTPIRRILEKVPDTGFASHTPDEFFGHLETNWLPVRFAHLCRHFMREVWKEIPEECWPRSIWELKRRHRMVDIVTEGITDPAERERKAAAFKRELEELRRQQEKQIPVEGRAASGRACYRIHQSDDFLGGDYCKIAEAGDGCLSVLLADATGHGPLAAPQAISLAGRVNDHPELIHEPGKMLANLNSLGAALLPAIHISVNPGATTLRYANAGHSPGLLIRENGTTLDLDEAAGMPLGVPNGLGATEVEIPLQSGDRIVLYTDGLEDSTNIAGVSFGRRRIAAAAHEARTFSAEEMVNAILETTRAFCGCPWEDDVTVAVIAI